MSFGITTSWYLPQCRDGVPKGGTLWWSQPGAQPLCWLISSPFPNPPSSPHTTRPKREAGRHLWKEQERQSQQNLDLEQPCRNGVPLLHSLLKNEDNDKDNVKTRVRDVTPFACAGSRKEIDFHPTREGMHVANLAQFPDPAPVADITNRSGLSFSLHMDAPSKASTKQAKIYWPSPSWSIQRPLPQVPCTAHTHRTHSRTYFPLPLGCVSNWSRSRPEQGLLPWENPTSTVAPSTMPSTPHTGSRFSLPASL